MRADPGTSAKNAKGAKNNKYAKNKQRPQPQPMPTRRKFLFFGMAGATVAAFGVAIADIPRGDTKTTTGAETDALAGSGIPTTRTDGAIGGPIKNPSWSKPAVRADFLALSGNTLLVQGETLSAFDAATGTPTWTAPNGTYAQSTDGTLPTTGDTVYATEAAGSDLVAVNVPNGSPVWSAPGPASWLTHGLIGASPDMVVGWSSIETGQTAGDGMFGVDPRSHQLRWSTSISGIDGAPYYSADTGLVLLSKPAENKLTAYDIEKGHEAWTAQDTFQSRDKGFATGIASHGKTIYWATNRLYAFDAQGRAVWPVGAAASEGGGFHAVIADDTTVYAAVTGTFSESVIAAYKAADGAPLWRAAWPNNFQSPSLECLFALGGGNLYIADKINGVLVALDAKTGETRWQFHDPAAAGAGVSWQIVANDQYVFAGYGTTLHGFKTG